MDDSRDLTAQGLRGLNSSSSNYAEWRDIVDDYLDSQGWESFIKQDIPAGAND